MKDKLSIVKDHIITGAIVVIPVAVIVVVLADSLKKLITLTEPITDVMDYGIPLLKSVVAALLIILGLGLFFLICGILLKTYLGRSFNSWMERHLFDKIPFFKTLQRVVTQFTGVEKGTYTVVEVQFENGSSILGIHTETLEDGRFLVFCPYAPIINIGQIHMVSKERVTPTKIKLKDFADIVTKIGLGAKELYKY